jgi:hypothetical protein
MSSGANLFRLAAVFAVGLALLLAAGCAGGDGEDFEVEVRESRDRVDDALAQVTDATTFDDLLRRLRTGASDVRGASDELAEEEAPEELRPEATELVEAYRALSGEMTATATALDDFAQEDGAPIQGINFENWDRTQQALTALRREGVDVPPLTRH